MPPIVSVVIPTHNRPHLVQRAIASALSQTIDDLEVIVYIDGLEQTTHGVLKTITDPRVRIVQGQTSLGGGGARNAGATVAQGIWIAFLDDDDEWLPQKLERQLAAAQTSRYQHPIVSCKLTGHTPTGKFVWPRRLLGDFEPISEYLLARNTLFHGEGMIQTSTILVKRELFQTLSFTADLQKHQEWDWLIRSAALQGVGFELVDEPLVIWYAEEKRQSVSSQNNWQYSLKWIQEIRHLVTPRAYAAFLMTVVGATAAREGERQAFGAILHEAIKSGKPHLIDFLLYASMWIVPQERRRQLRALLVRKHQVFNN